MILDEKKLPQWCRPAWINLSQASGWMLTGDDWAQIVTHCIENSLKRIEICQYSITANWPKNSGDKSNIWRALLDAPTRGIACRALLAQHAGSARTAYFNNRAARALAAHGWQVRRSPPARLLHAKLIMFDGCAVSHGSHNVSATASNKNIEISTLIESQEACAPFSAWFESQW